MLYPTLRDVYTNSINTYAARTAFSLYEGESVTYAEFSQRVETVQTILLRAGLEKGDKVALLCSSMPNWNVCYFATVTLGMVIVPILPDFSSAAIASIMEHSESRALFVSDKLFAKIPNQAKERMDLMIRAVNLAVIGGKKARTAVQQTERSIPESEDLAAIIYTSGTTSSPKGVMLSHRALCNQLQRVCSLTEVVATDVFLSILPLSHTYECSLGMLYPFMKGASVVYLGVPPTPSNMLPALKKIRPTFMLTVPLIMEKIYTRQVFARFTRNKVMKTLYRVRFIRRRLHRMAGKRLYNTFGGRLRFFGIGGSKLNRATEKFLRDARFPYSIGYGLTETAPLIAGAVHPDTYLESTGRVMEGIQIRIEDKNPENGVGEIQVKTPCIMEGYYKNPEADSEAFTEDGWFRTKDLGEIDSSGRLFIRGRLSNMIVGSSGENVYPEEIENILNQHELVTESLVIQRNGKLVALVYLQDLKQELRDQIAMVHSDIMNYVNSKVGKMSRITSIQEQENGFEKTPTQKIKRYLYTEILNRKGKKSVF
ncbi:MAG: AMP-binding protein [Bacteroidales bacterium]|nr:AMP-binding protein [Bacteroidales bacterium]MDD3696843.1 AMP-binding protein [Bacteroidales bacterium]